jgi:hypothetical protein
MRKAQVSAEFIVIFTIVIFVFAVLISFYPDWLEKTTAARNIPETVAKDIKARVITASLSESDFKSNLIIPEKINGVRIRIDINKTPDNMLTIRDDETGRTLARAFLPKIDVVAGSPYDLNLTIIKNGTGDSTRIIIRQS